MKVLPQLARGDAEMMIEAARAWNVFDLGRYRPDTSAPVTYPVTGLKIDDASLAEIRSLVLTTARDCGYPMVSPSGSRISQFDGRVARILHDRLGVTPHAAADEPGWSYLTICWLFDVAIWRYGKNASADRFIGHVNRNTFRRLWWRAEVLGPDVDLEQIQEDELVGLMERPRLSRDRRLARAIASELLVRVDDGAVTRRMTLMRETSKRILRLSPFIAFDGLAEDELRALVRRTFDESAAALAGTPVNATSSPASHQSYEPSSLVTRVRRVVDDATGPVSDGDVSLDEIRRVALRIASSTGRVTNVQLRTETDLDNQSARQVLAGMVQDGVLARRGVKRGSHYVIADQEPPDREV